MISVHHASMLDWLAAYDGPQFDSCVTDPPYHLTSIVKRFGGKNAAEAKVGATGAYARASRGFMGKEWDGEDISFRPDTWRLVYDNLKPGAHLIAFSGTRTYHRMACAIEDAGFEIRDQLAWIYGSGFPKSHDISKAIDKAAGAEREIIGYKTQGAKSMFDGGKPRATSLPVSLPVSLPASLWQGWGTALKPAWEPICLARKPLSEKTVGTNVLKHGVGAINIDGCRIDGPGWFYPGSCESENNSMDGKNYARGPMTSTSGRWPANILTDGSDEVLAGFPDTGLSSGGNGLGTKNHVFNTTNSETKLVGNAGGLGNSGSAARFFYSAKAGPLDRIGTAHATVKPVDVMRWLVQMVTPPGGHVLEPFAGSGKTGIACMAEGFDCTMIDLEAEHVADIERQLKYLRGDGAMKFEEHNYANNKRAKDTPLGGLFQE